MSGWFDRMRTRMRIRRAIRLRYHLRKSYGTSDSYTADQVRVTAKTQRLSSETLIWALALYCTQAEFAAAEIAGDYTALRAEMDEALKRNAALAGSEGVGDDQAILLGGNVDGGGSDGGDGGSGGGDGGGGGD
ncbi:MAG: DUF6559 family protein [Pseudomonadota bacterium]